ncbi:MAG TPA: efflux RND transporter periplasmic adaptor subunit [Methylomirabilota bacterium]|nr:efflux RND transporter periplasmic adaptor subunit [Methylomirabilota bacterium]
MRLRALAASALLLFAAVACGKSDAQAPQQAKGAPAIKPIPITVAKAEAREVQRSVETIGSILAWDETQVKTEQPGTVARLTVDLGDAVTRGQVLAAYDAREFELAVRQTEADFAAAREAVARVKSEVEWTTSELRRNQELYTKQLIAARDVDNARNLANVAAARLAEAEAEAKRREATLGIARKRLGDTTIRSSMTGVVAKRHINAGEYVKENTVVFTVVALDPLKYTGTVSERFAPELKAGQRIELSVEAYPGQSFAGEVTRVAPAVEVQTRSLALEGRVPNKDGRLRPGFFAKGVVLSRRDTAVAFVPAEAVVYFVGISKVFVVADGKVEERLIRAGTRQGAWVEIASGVKPGETVAVTNLSQLFNGAPVALIESKAPGR